VTKPRDQRGFLSLQQVKQDAHIMTDSPKFKDFKVRTGIDWIVCHAHCPMPTDPNTLRDSIKFKRLGVSSVRDWKRNSNKICTDYTLTIQDPTPARLKALAAEGVELGALIEIEYFIDFYRKATGHNANLAAMANFLADTLDFKSTATEQISFNHSDISSRTSEQMLNGDIGKVSLTTSMYYGNSNIAGRVYYKTTDNKTKLNDPEHRARLEFTTSSNLLPCKNIADLSSVDWKAWVFDELGYCPRQNGNTKPLLAYQNAPDSKHFKNRKHIEPARRPKIFPNTKPLPDAVMKAIKRQLGECGETWGSW
jgi:hypothetical protein